ncbi:glucose N-acetyltransferase [Xylariales sp. PMI_506]|nr:glucose N-acetyltransferase [Xylariales sp. PMI_506]
MSPLRGALSSLYRYNPLQSSEQSSATTADSLNTMQVRPSVGQILMSKRVRYAGTALAAFGLFLFTLRNYDQLPAIDTWKPSMLSGTSNSNCPVAQVVSYDESNVNWSRFAYTQYVTNQQYLCNSVMIFETLYRLGSKADRVMMYPETMLDPKATESSTEEGRLIIKARDKYKVKLVPISVQRRMGGDSTWAESYTKLLAFNQTQYQRVLNVDSDATILQHMDELFMMPPCPVAMPRAYWLFPDNKILSSQLMLIQPSAAEFDRVMKKMEAASSTDYDMEIVNQLYIDQAMILPHRPYDLLTGEFRGEKHENYLGTDREEWDPVTIFNEAKYLHFSDWPVPKPWIPMQESVRNSKQPACVTKNGQEDCSARELWNGFYSDFKDRRAVRIFLSCFVWSSVIRVLM